MTKVDRWLLPEGIEEILPNQAFQVETLRRNLLDIYDSWGYDLVIPPLVEFTDSLLGGSGTDLDLLTFKITDQLSGQMMGVRADITPQTARMDAHSLRRSGPNRLCYASSVLYTRARTPLASRSPIQVGVELYGEAGLSADLEVISLMLEALTQSGVTDVCLDLGHVGVYKRIEQWLTLNANQKTELFDLLQSKSCELSVWIADNIDNPDQAALLQKLPGLAGGSNILSEARDVLAQAPAEVSTALNELQTVVDSLTARNPDLNLYLDLCELEGYHYHTGVVFAAYCQGARQAVGHGGRYDDIGESFGRARPATGFSIDLKALVNLLTEEDQQRTGIYVPYSDDSAFYPLIKTLRADGERVVCGFPGQTPNFTELCCDRQIIFENGVFTVKPISDER